MSNSYCSILVELVLLLKVWQSLAVLTGNHYQYHICRLSASLLTVTGSAHWKSLPVPHLQTFCFSADSHWQCSLETITSATFASCTVAIILLIVLLLFLPQWCVFKCRGELNCCGWKIGESSCWSFHYLQKCLFSFRQFLHNWASLCLWRWYILWFRRLQRCC